MATSHVNETSGSSHFYATSRGFPGTYFRDVNRSAGGNVRTTELPQLPTTTKRAREVFNKHAAEINAEWFNRERMGMTGRVEGANAWFKRQAYALIIHYINHNLLRQIARNFKEDDRPHKLVEESARNPFKMGLLAMFDDETLSRSNRHTFGNQMLFAWAHQVPPDFLNAFLAVTGGPAQISKKLKAKIPEPGFEHRFKPERLDL